MFVSHLWSLCIYHEADLSISTHFKVWLTESAKLAFFSWCSPCTHSIMIPNISRLVYNLTSKVMATMIHKASEIKNSRVYWPLNLYSLTHWNMCQSHQLHIFCVSHWNILCYQKEHYNFYKFLVICDVIDGQVSVILDQWHCDLHTLFGPHGCHWWQLSDYNRSSGDAIVVLCRQRRKILIWIFRNFLPFLGLWHPNIIQNGEQSIICTTIIISIPYNSWWCFILSYSDNHCFFLGIWESFVFSPLRESKISSSEMWDIFCFLWAILCNSTCGSDSHLTPVDLLDLKLSGILPFAIMKGFEVSVIWLMTWLFKLSFLFTICHGTSCMSSLSR